MTMSERIFDCKGTLLAVGQRVIENGEEVGTIIELTESDGDWNDELGRAEQYGPYVHVRFDPCDDYPVGVEDRFICSWNGRSCGARSAVCASGTSARCASCPNVLQNDSEPW